MRVAITGSMPGLVNVCSLAIAELVNENENENENGNGNVNGNSVV